MICQDLHLDFVETKKRNKQWFGKKKKQFTVYHVFSIVGPQLGVQAVSGQNRITCALRLATL